MSSLKNFQCPFADTEVIDRSTKPGVIHPTKEPLPQVMRAEQKASPKRQKIENESLDQRQSPREEGARVALRDRENAGIGGLPAANEEPSKSRASATAAGMPLSNSKSPQSCPIYISYDRYCHLMRCSFLTTAKSQAIIGIISVPN